MSNIDLKIDKTSWVIEKVGGLATEISERVENPAQSNFGKFVGLQHFISGDLKISRCAGVDNLVSAAKAFQAGDILLARRNAYLRRAALVEFNGICSGDAFVLRENPEKLLPGFLSIIVNSSLFWDFANSNAAGTMSKRVKWRDLSEFEVLMPSKGEQQKISDLVWSSYRETQAKQTLKPKITRLVSTSFKEFFDQDFGKYTPLGQCGEWKSGGTPSRKNMSFWGGDISWVSPKDMKTEYISGSIEKITDDAVENGARILPKSSLLVVVRGLILAHSFPVGLTRKDVSFNQDIKALIPSGKYRPEFILYFLQYKKQDVLNMITTTTHGTKRLSSDALFGLLVPDVSLHGQDLFIQKIKKQKDVLYSIDRCLIHSKELNQNIINQVF